MSTMLPPGFDRRSKLIKEIFGRKVFDTPKPLELLEWVVGLAPDSDAIFLDSFAGSGTTGHAVLKANADDGGSRKFILVEGEPYADDITAERIRRVICGYEFTGKQREELLRENVTFTMIRRGEKLIHRIAGIENMDGHRFDRIKKEVKDGVLTVTGETEVTERVDGLGGSFTFCTLGAPLEMDRLLTGDSLPSFEALASIVFRTATNEALEGSRLDKNPLGHRGLGYIGESASFHVWLIYEPDLDFLKSPESALTKDKARAISERFTEKPHLVFAPARFVSQRLLNEENIPVEFAPLPFALSRIEVG